MQFFSFFTTKSLISIIKNDDVDSLKTAIRNKEIADSSTTSETSESKLTLIYAASCKGAYKSLIYLLKIKADPNLYSYLSLFKEYWSPLHLAVANNHTSLIGILILHGANPDLPYKGKTTGSSRFIASEELKVIIKFFEEKYCELKELAKIYDDKKNAADSEYKKEDRSLSKGLYTDAYNCRSQMKAIWQTVAGMERNIIIKSYYEEKIKEQDDSMKILKTVSTIDEASSASLSIDFNTEFDISDPSQSQFRV